MKGVMFAACLGVAIVSCGCEDDDKPQSTGGGAAPAATRPAGSGEHDRLPIGQTTISGLTLVATMDKPVKPGDEGAFDVVITGGTPKAVRFWVGTESAEGSVKAKAEEETPANWHAHAEVPEPLAPGSRFWVEVEPPAGQAFKASFDLKLQ